MPCTIPPSQLGLFIGKLIGKLEGLIMAQVTKLIAKVLQELLGNFCPDLSILENILKTRDSLINKITLVEKKIEPIAAFADKLDPPIKAAKIIITLLEMLPVPGTIGLPPGPGGGVIYSISVGKQNRLAQLLNIACKIVEMLEQDQKAIKYVTNSALATMTPVKAKLMSLDFKLFTCVDKLPQDQKDHIMSVIENLPSNVGLLDEKSIDDAGGTVYGYTKPSSGKEYTIKIEEDKDSPSYAKRRYAVVYDSFNIAVLKGPKSFSSSTKILLDELKFRLDNQLP